MIIVQPFTESFASFTSFPCSSMRAKLAAEMSAHFLVFSTGDVKILSPTLRLQMYPTESFGAVYPYSGLGSLFFRQNSLSDCFALALLPPKLDSPPSHSGVIGGEEAFSVFTPVGGGVARGCGARDTVRGLSCAASWGEKVLSTVAGWVKAVGGNNLRLLGSTTNVGWVD